MGHLNFMKSFGE